MAEHEEEVEYTDAVVGVSELAWGDGFISPGGKAEIDLFLEGVDISGQAVLDVGCGAGGCDVVLVRDHGAAHVHGIDIEQPLLDGCVARARQHGLADRLSYQKVKPGPFPLADDNYDVVFSKDALIHIEDKYALFLEVFRVLKPGGLFVASDWMSGTEEKPGPELQRWLDLVGLSLGVNTPRVYVEAMEKAGFVEISTRDRNQFVIEALRADCALLSGDGHAELIRRCGDEAQHWIETFEAAYAAAKSGELRPGHLRGYKPAA